MWYDLFLLFLIFTLIFKKIIGKSSLLRLLCGLWRYADGKVLKPEIIGNGGIFYVPQKTYTFPGTLKDQITYPSSTSEDWQNSDDIAQNEEELYHILKAVNLGHLLTRYGGWNSRHNWQAVLSLGEQQRLGMARVFYHRPTLAVLDEATSAGIFNLHFIFFSYFNI